jgi:hypothetical protein
MNFAGAVLCDSDSDPAGARSPVSPRRHGGHGDLTEEASAFSLDLRVLPVYVVNKALEFFLSLASRNPSVLVMTLRRAGALPS